MKISLLVPFRPTSTRDPRIRTWKWLEKRWGYLLPEAELCVGTDTGGEPFSKSVAVNDAYAKSSGDMLVIADADSWVERPGLMMGIEAAARKEHLVVPWWRAFRLAKEDSDKILKMPFDARVPVTKDAKDRATDSGPAPDSAAMVIVLQRSAFERVGGFDPRFRGWGSEDVSFGLSCWTLLGRNEYNMGEAYALYHTAPYADIDNPDHPTMRVWAKDEGGRNFPLWDRYSSAQGYPEAMLKLCAEHALPGHQVSLSPTWDADDMVPMGGKGGDREPIFTTPIQQDRRDVEPITRETLY